MGYHPESAYSAVNIVLLLVAIAGSYGLRMSVCAQPELVVPGAYQARCIDAKRLMALSGKTFVACLGGARRSCGCYRARDLGVFDTCLNGCVYCYATQRPEIARLRKACAADL